MPDKRVVATLNDIGTEELAHWEMIGTLVYKLTKDATIAQIKGTPFEAHYVNHGKALYPHDAAGVPWTATYFNAKDDPVADLHENMQLKKRQGPPMNG